MLYGSYFKTDLHLFVLLGDFDSTGSTNSMLKHLLEQRTIGNREFLPLSGQALLGFRLLPGAVRLLRHNNSPTFGGICSLFYSGLRKG